MITENLHRLASYSSNCIKAIVSRLTFPGEMPGQPLKRKTIKSLYFDPLHVLMLTSWITSQLSQWLDTAGCFKLNALLSSQHRTPTAIIPLLLRFWRVNSIAGCSLYKIMMQLDSKGTVGVLRPSSLFFEILASKERNNGGFSYCTLQGFHPVGFWFFFFKNVKLRASKIHSVQQSCSHNCSNPY